MLTRQGWLALFGAGGLLVVGRLLGVYELYLLGSALAALVIVSALVTGLSRLRLEVARELHPPRVHAGSPSRVDVAIGTAGPRATPVLRLRDPVSGTRGAELLVSPLGPGERARAAYRLPTERRGVLTIGPLDVTVADPFGLTSTSLRAAGLTQLTVYPRIDDIVPVPHTHGHDPHAGAEHPNALTLQGEDFYALRPYVVGDDLRRVHWKSTARHGDLMVRQDELPWQGRVTILADVRRTTNTPDSLELVVSAAASVATASWQRRDLVRMVTTDGTDSGYAGGHAHVESIMEHLATVQSSPGGSLPRILDALRRSGYGGALVVILAAVPEAELDSIARLRSGFGLVTTVVFEPSSFGRSSQPAPRSGRAGGAGGNVVRVTAAAPFATAWNEKMKSRGERRTRAIS